jgi:glutathione synthase/RimK-type ligase-like ATP-grasp enzyme
MRNIALATCRKYPDFTPDEHLLIVELAASGVKAAPLIWDDPQDFEAIREFDAIVIRTCWDYHFKPAQFLKWIETLEQNHVHVINAPSVIRWNFEKTYLRDLAGLGVSIPASVWLEPGEPADLASILASQSWPRAVLKPTISATAWQTRLVGPGTDPAAQAHLDAMLQTGGVIIQEYLNEVAVDGEWSLIFFNRVFSYAVLKRAAAGDFRVQQDFGGSFEPAASPPPAALAAATAALEIVSGEILYARVDGVLARGKFLLMELELIEPALFLTANPNAARTFAAAIVSSLERQ